MIDSCETRRTCFGTGGSHFNEAHLQDVKFVSEFKTGCLNDDFLVNVFACFQVHIFMD